MYFVVQSLRLCRKLLVLSDHVDPDLRCFEATRRANPAGPWRTPCAGGGKLWATAVCKHWFSLVHFELIRKLRDWKKLLDNEMLNGRTCLGKWNSETDAWLNKLPPTAEALSRRGASILWKCRGFKRSCHLPGYHVSLLLFRCCLLSFPKSSLPWSMAWKWGPGEWTMFHHSVVMQSDLDPLNLSQQLQNLLTDLPAVGYFCGSRIGSNSVFMSISKLTWK